MVRVGRAEDTHRHGRLAANLEKAEDTHHHGVAAASQVRADPDQERVGRVAEGTGTQAHHLVVTVINLAMVEDIQMEEDTTADTMVMEVIQEAQVDHLGLLAVNLGRAAVALRGHLVERVGSQALDLHGRPAERVARAVVTHHLLPRDLGIHPEVVTPNHRIPNLPTIVVLKMMVTTLVAMEANGTRDHRPHREAGHLLVANRGRAEVDLQAHRVAGAHHRRVNLASLDTEKRVTYVLVGYNINFLGFLLS